MIHMINLMGAGHIKQHSKASIRVKLFCQPIGNLSSHKILFSFRRQGVHAAQRGPQEPDREGVGLRGLQVDQHQGRRAREGSDE